MSWNVRLSATPSSRRRSAGSIVRKSGVILGNARRRARELEPAAVLPRLDPVQLVEGVLAFSCVHSEGDTGIEAHPDAVARAVGEDPLDVRADLAADGGPRVEERVVGQGGPVVVQPQRQLLASAV
jgi:hypothetical protein